MVNSSDGRKKKAHIYKSNYIKLSLFVNKKRSVMFILT